MKEINITERAHKEIKRLFSLRSSVNTLRSDPELTEIFDNFAFDQTLSVCDAPLLEKTRVMCILSSTIGSNSLTEFKIYVDAALNVGIKPREVREVIYQSVPYVGFSKVLDFLLAMNEVFENNDIKLPLDRQSTVTDETRAEKGMEWMNSIYGEDVVKRMFDTIPEGQEHIYEFMRDYCFGNFYTRNGVTMRVRELMTFCFLAAMGGCEHQLKAHAGGNKHVGNSKVEMVAAVTAILPYIGFPKSMNALEAINEAYGD